MHVLIEDRGYNIDTKSINFETLPRPNAADFSMKFKVRTINEKDKKDILTNIAFLLSLNTTQL